MVETPKSDFFDERMAMRSLLQTVVGQIDRAGGTLLRSVLSDEQVHAARKDLKRGRATLRLLRRSLGCAAYRRENRQLRDTARCLSALRDPAVLLGTMQRLRALPDGGIASPALRQIAVMLRQERESVRRRLSLPLRRRAVARLESVKGRLLSIEPVVLETGDLAERLAHAYQKARRAFAAARARPDDERLHEWRKQVKYWTDQLQIVLGACKAGEKLADHLGNDHDLALLAVRIRELNLAVPAVLSEDTGRAIDLLLVKRRTFWQRKAFKLAAALFADSPRAVERRLRKRMRRKTLRRC